jgi:type III restriction enzyme
VAQLTIDLIREKYERELKGGHKELKSPEVQKRIAEDVRRISKARQGTLEGIVTQPDVEQLVAVVTASIADNSIEIPEIVVLPSREVNFWFEDFDLSSISDIRFQPISDRLLVRNLRDQTQRELARTLDGPREDRIENYIVRFLMDYPEVDYDSQADLLYKLAGQMVDHLRSYLQNEDDVENVALAQGKALAQRIIVQMKQHYRQTPAEYRATKVRSFRSLDPQNIAYSPAKSLMLTESASPLSATPGYTFRGGQKSPYKFHKFHSDPERRFAVLIDSDFEKDVIRWLKPARNQFRIEYQPGKPYEPDFVIELSDRKLIAEIKAERDMADPIVKEKARAAAEWIKLANEFAAEGDGKPWAYALIPDQAITENATLGGLVARYGNGT